VDRRPSDSTDRTRWGSFDELDERSQQQVRGIVEALPAQAPDGSSAQKVGDYYRAYLDTAAIERAGLAPAQAGWMRSPPRIPTRI